VTGDQYVGQLLANYAVPRGQGSPSLNALGVVVPSLRTWANKYLGTIGPSGSFAKGTGVLGTTDLDVFVGITNNAPENLQEIYESLHNWSAKQLWFPQRQNVSIGITWLGAKVDIVPGKRQANLSTDYSLWKNKQKTWRQTNVATHISTVVNSGRVNEIRALKIWRKCHNLDFPSFYLELTVMDALWRKTKGLNLAANVSTCLEYIRENLETSCVIDSANTANVISDDLTAAEKKKIANAAGESREKKYWAEVLW
jgi:hypothetical protein